MTVYIVSHINGLEGLTESMEVFSTFQKAHEYIENQPEEAWMGYSIGILVIDEKAVRNSDSQKQRTD